MKVNFHKKNSFWLMQWLLVAGLVVCPMAVHADQAQYFYDELGRLQAVTDGQGNTAIYAYDAVGNLLSITRRTAGEVTILSIIPSIGLVGSPVTINGIGFSATPANNQVTFGGGVAAAVLTSNTTSLTVNVPNGAVTGPITVTTSTGLAVSPKPFTVSLVPNITGISPTYGMQASNISEFRITGINFQGSTSVQFVPSDGISVTNPPTVSADGTTAVVSVGIAPTALLSLRTVTITNLAGTSSSTATDQNTFLVLPSQPFVASSNAVGVYVQPSAAESFGTLLYGTNATVGVFVEPSPAESFGMLLLAPYVGVQTAP